jgi:MFS family permease
LAAAALWGFAFSSFYLLPKFLTRELAAGPDEVGFVVGVFGLATVAFTPFAGRCIDRFPRRYALVAGSVLMGLSALGFLAVHSVGALIGGLRVVQGVSYALVVTAVGTMVADLVPAARLSQALGMSGASMLIMNAIAPAIAEPLAVAAGWPATFLAAAAAALASASLAGGIGEPARPVRADGERDGLLAVLERPVARHYAIVTALAGSAFGAVMTFEPPYVLELGAERVGSFFVAYAAGAILVRLLFGHTPDRFGRHRVAVGALLLYALVVLAIAAMRPSNAPILGAVFGIAHGLFFPALNALAVTAVPVSERGRVMAIFTGSFSLGLWAGATVLGVVAARAGYPATFVAASLGAGTALIVLVRSHALRHADARGAPCTSPAGAGARALSPPP